MAPPSWLVKEGAAALGCLLSEPALEHAVAQLFDVLKGAAGEHEAAADDLLRIAAQVSDAALDSGCDAAEVELRIGDIAAYLLVVQSYWSANASKYASWKLVRPAAYLAKEDIEAAVRAALDARDPYTATKLSGTMMRAGKALIITSLALLISSLALSIIFEEPLVLVSQSAPEPEIELNMEDPYDRLSITLPAFFISLAASAVYMAHFRSLGSSDWLEIARLAPEWTTSCLVVFAGAATELWGLWELLETAEADMTDVWVFFYFIVWFLFFTALFTVVLVARVLMILPAAWRSSLLRWQLFGSMELIVPLEIAASSRPWMLRYRLPGNRSLVDFCATVPLSVGPGQKFTHVAPPMPPPPPARRSWWSFGSPPPPPVPPADQPTTPEPQPAAAPPRVKTPKQQAAVALKRARQKDRRRRLTKEGSHPLHAPRGADKELSQ